MSKAEYILSVILIGVMFVAGCAITTKAEVVDNPYQTIPISDEEFEELRWVVNIAYLRCNHSSDTCRNASDLWSSIRHALYNAEPHDPDSWDVRSREPIQLGTEQLPKVEVQL